MIRLRSFLAMAVAMVSVAVVAPGCMSEDEAPVSEPVVAPGEEVRETAQAAGSCPESLSCPARNNNYNLTQVYKNCDASGDTLSFTCKYANNSTIVKTPASTSCNECSISTSQGTATCGQWQMTTYAIATCSAG